MPASRTVSKAQAVAAGVSWLWAITLFSGVSFLAQVSDWNFRMLVGMGTPLVVTALAYGGSVSSALLSGLATAILLIGFAALALAAARGKRAAFLIAAVFYLFDGLLLAVFGDWPSVAFHALGLWFIVRAWIALRGAVTGAVAGAPAAGASPDGASELLPAVPPTQMRFGKLLLIALGGFLVVMLLIGASVFLFTFG